MKNLEPCSKNSFEFYQSIINSLKTTKRDPQLRTRLNKMSDRVESQFGIYDQNYLGDCLGMIDNIVLTDKEKEDLLKLYSFKRKIIQELKIEVTTSENNRVINTCQNCGLNEVNSFDHFVPKEEFSEYSIHPLNLIPSCTTCNSYKGSDWREDKEVLFLNIYLDVLPTRQYLFAEIDIEDDVVLPSFRIENVVGIPDSLFRKISFHYERLRLLERFQNNSDSVITSLENSILAHAGKLSMSDIVEVVEDSSKRNLEYFGRNHWQSILELQLVKSDSFRMLLEKRM